MKRFAIFSAILTLLLLASSPSFAADSGGGDDQTGSIIDFFSIAEGGCGSSSMTTPCNDDPNNGLFASIACKVMKSFNNGVVPIYCNIVSNSDYLAAIDAAMMLYVVIMGLCFTFGLVPMTAGQLVAKLLRATIVYTITINADIYFSLIYNTVLQTPQDAVRIMLNSSTGAASGGGGATNFFDYVDKAMYKVMHDVYQAAAPQGSGQTYSKSYLKVFLLGLAMWQLGGDLVGGIFYAVTIGWVLAYFSIMVRYLLAMLSLMFVLMLGPLFIPTMLFEQTKYLAEEWMYMMLNFIMQIVLVVAFVLMVQPFFTQFYDLIKDGLDKVTMQPADSQSLVTFNNNNTDAANGAFRAEKRKDITGMNPQTAEQLYQQAFGKNYKQDLPDKVFHFIEVLVMVIASTTFLAYVPSLASMMIGRPRFIRIFLGNQFGPKDKMMQANLLGQGPGTPNPVDRYTVLEDKADAAMDRGGKP